MPQNRVKYQISGGLESDGLRAIHETAMELVERIGISAPHRAILSLLSQHNGVSIKGNVVCFERFLVEKAMRGMIYPDWVNKLEYAIISGAYALNVLDLENGEIRSATTIDLQEMTRLCDGLCMLGSAPVRPTDIQSKELQEIALYKISYENSEHKSSDIFDANPKSSLSVAEYTYEMAQVAARFFSIGIMVVSPFRLMESELEIIYQFLDRKVPIMVTALPMAGATGPFPLVGAHVQSLAEIMAAVTLLSLISRGSPVYASPIDSIRAHPFDMKHASFVYGSPEDLLGSLIQCQINQRYGIPIVAKSLLTNAKLPDSQAAAEKAAHTLAAALAGARIFTCAGVLAVDDVYSPEQAVIDYEIVQYVRRVMEGLEFTDEVLSINAITDVGIGGNFIIHPTTLSRYKRERWMPDLFDRTMIAQWQHNGAHSLRERARQIARKHIADHHYELSMEVQRELNKIWDTAVNEFGR